MGSLHTPSPERDVTKANEELRKVEERYHKMIAEVEDYAIILLDTDGIIQNWNKGAEKIKQYKESEILGQHFSKFYLPEDLARNLPNVLLNEAKQNGRATQEGWRKRKDGSRFWGSITITALHDTDNTVIGYSKVTRDLTERKQAEEKLLAYAKELEIRNRDLEQFAYVTSHDLQEPLRKIRTFTDIIEKNPDNTALVSRYFAKINQSAERMTNLIKSVLNYSRLSQNTSHLALVDLNDVVAQVKTDFELLIAEKHAVISHDTLPSIPANRPQLEQLFSNLISNAIKFNENKPVVTLRARTVNTHEALNPPNDLPAQMLMEIAVADNGIGFEPQYANLIFTMFQRLEDQAAYAGTGIGLALCKKIMENHHGYITVASERGKGTTFYVYFPLHPPQH